MTKSCELHFRYDASKDTSYETIEIREHTISTHFDYRHRDESETWKKDDDVEKKLTLAHVRLKKKKINVKKIKFDDVNEKKKNEKNENEKMRKASAESAKDKKKK